MPYYDPKTGKDVILQGSLGEQNLQANKMGLDWRPPTPPPAPPAPPAPVYVPPPPPPAPVYVAPPAPAIVTPTFTAKIYSPAPVYVAPPAPAIVTTPSQSIKAPTKRRHAGSKAKNLIHYNKGKRGHWTRTFVPDINQ